MIINIFHPFRLEIINDFPKRLQNVKLYKDRLYRVYIVTERQTSIGILILEYIWHKYNIYLQRPLEIYKFLLVFIGQGFGALRNEWIYAATHFL